MDEYWIFDEVIDEQAPNMWLNYLGQSNVNLVNLHTSIYGLLLVHEDDEELSDIEQDRLVVARSVLELHISCDELYSIMGGDVASYSYDPRSTLEYANRIIEFYNGGKN